MTAPVDEEEELLSVVRELGARRRALDSLIGFTEYTFPKYRTATHHKLIAHELEGVEAGEHDRVMLLCAPRHGKSELASKRFPSWSLGRRPDRHVISASAGGELASDWGREVRNIVGSEAFHRLYPGVSLAEDMKARNKWLTDVGGGYFAVGIGGDVIGRGADLLIIDDPFGTMEDAQSETMRKKVWDWYQGTAYNRLQPGGAIVVINHRMHEDDLSGRLLAQQAAGGDRWRVVELPALADDANDALGRKIGEALWPERYPVENLERIRRNTPARYWSSLYQQKPAPDDGTFFKAEWLKPYRPNDRPAKGTMAFTGRRTSLSRRARATIPSTSSRASIRPASSGCSISGAVRSRPIRGSRPGAISSSSGSRSAGRLRRDRLTAVSGRS